MNSTKSIIIGLCGRAGSGKSTIAKFLSIKYGFVEFSFAKKLKEVVSVISGFDGDFLGGTVSRQSRETVKDNVFGMTARELLQKVGMLFRDHFCADFWVKLLMADILKYTTFHKNPRIVISDCRFENEIMSVLNLTGSYLFVLSAPQDPHMPDNIAGHISETAYVPVIKKIEKTASESVYNITNTKDKYLFHQIDFIVGGILGR